MKTKRKRLRREQSTLGAIGDRILLSVVIGVIAGGMLAAWATVVRVVAGPGAFQALGVSFLLVAVTYVGAGALGGIIAGLLWPLTRSSMGVAVLGFLVALGVVFLVTLSMIGVRGWTSADLVAVVVVAFALGPVLALWFRRFFREL